ncbi:HNH endonuclease signature motif containing protein [Pseudonocardia sp. TRM90224]|uniref:HNH endonuclease signature motif containing protein n=1 Tax=Pseudonocardia sp. TRM90224 TaxID=2812678 RepID=UPI001E5E9969|nr:HNH endonuclease signature motif containing protein [Pseudonocardia sp. TRM90224]
MSRGLDTTLDGIAELQVETATGTFPDRFLASRDMERVVREIDRARVQFVADFLREGGFGSLGYRAPIGALADSWNIDWGTARQYVNAAQNLCPQVGLTGTVLEPRMPICAAAFADATIGLGHVDVIRKVLESGEASRLSPAMCDEVEQRVVEYALLNRPSEVFKFGMDVVRGLDQDGPEPEDRPEAEVNELTITPHPDRPGGVIKGRFDNPVLFATIATLIDAKSKPAGADDQRGSKQRQAEALADVCGYVLDHGDVPQSGGHRPHLNVHIPLTELETRVRTAILDFGGAIATKDLRQLACNAAVIPIVMNSDSQPLDIGRLSRVIPDGMRRAVAARDRGCARCGRPASWCDIHHVVEWQNGGQTEINNLVMLCRMHHREIHATEWIVRMVDGIPEFIPPRYVDPDQFPRRRPTRALLH